MGKYRNVGGQAVIEGVMMRGKCGTATAVRTQEGNIVVDFKEIVPYTKKYKILGLPIIRGFVSLVESLIIGIKTLNYSASFFEEDDEKVEGLVDKVFKDKADDFVTGISLIISFAFAIGVFFVLPNFIANIFKKINVSSNIALNLIDGVIRVVFLLLYIYLISKMKDIRRVFEYHGAEHKTIFCYENDKKLTPENAAKFGRFHPRCGTNFLFLVMIVSIILFSFTKWTNSLVERSVIRIVLLPLVSGITYEVIRWMGKSDSKISKIFAYPGLMLQKLTTREPDASQLEVAIKALMAAEGLEENSSSEETTVENK